MCGPAHKVQLRSTCQSEMWGCSTWLLRSFYEGMHPQLPLIYDCRESKFAPNTSPTSHRIPEFSGSVVQYKQYSQPLSHHTHHKPLVKAKTINFTVIDRAQRSRKIIQFWAQYSSVSAEGRIKTLEIFHCWWAMIFNEGRYRFHWTRQILLSNKLSSFAEPTCVSHL
jgi:hypothetical protein